MTQLEKQRLTELEKQLFSERHLLAGLMPLHAQVDRRVKALINRIAHIEGEIAKLHQGQLVMPLGH